MGQLYNTTGEDPIDYNTNESNIQKSTGNPPDGKPVNPYIFSTVIGNPKYGVRSAPGKSEFTRPEEEVTRFDEGFMGESQAALDKYRVDTQSTISKVGNTVLGGVLDGIGTLIEDAGYLTDLNTYAGIFGDIDHGAVANSGLMKYTNLGLVSRGLSEIGKGIKDISKENLLAYENQKEGITDQILSYGTFRGIIDSAVGFALLGGGVSKGVSATGKYLLKELAAAGEWAKVAEEANKLRKLPSVLQSIEKSKIKLARTAEWANNIAQIGMKTNPELFQTMGAVTSSIFTKAAEARMEGLSSYEDRIRELQPLVDNGTMSKELAEKEANIAANHAAHMTILTMAGDAMMLKGFFNGKSMATSIIDKPGFKSTLLNVGKSVAKNAPKEAFEEMWQEKANMEGSYFIYNAIKDRLSSDEKLNYIKSIGFNPEDMPKGFIARTAVMMDSNRVKVAGLVGALSGPLQGLGIHLVRKASGAVAEEKKEEQRQYEEQQLQFTKNKTLNDQVNEFTTKLKEVIVSQSMRELAAMSGDDVMMDIANEIAFTNVASENFAKGTTDQLEEVLSENKTAESAKLKTVLQEMKKDFRKSKSYVNPEEVFVRKQEIKQQKKIVDHFLQKANDESLPETERKAYAKEGEKGIKQVEKLENELKELTSIKYQTYLLNREKDNIELAEVIANLDKENNIGRLQSLAKKFPGVDAIQQKIQTIQSNKPKTTPNKPIEVDVKEKETYSGEVEEEGRKKKKQKQTIQDVVDGVELVGNQKVKNGFPVYNEEQQNKEFSKIINAQFAKFNAARNTKVTDRDNNTLNKAKELYAKERKNIVDEESLMFFGDKLAILIEDNFEYLANEGVETPTETPVHTDTFNKALNTLIEVIELSNPETQKNLDVEEVMADDSNDPGIHKKRVDAMFNFIEACIIEGIPVKGNFKLLAQTIASTPQGAVMIQNNDNFELLKALYKVYDIKYDINSIPGSYNELMGIVVDDFNTVEGMPTAELKADIERIINEEGFYSPNLDKLTGETVIEVTGDKNTFPATSMAHLSQAYKYAVSKISKTIEVIKETVSRTVNGNPLLNPNKFNKGDAIEFKLQDDYEGDVKFKGKLVNWKTVIKPQKDTWEQFKKEQGLSKDALWTDYYPITISSEADGVVSYVHDVEWVNEKNAAGDPTVLKESQEKLRAFKKDVYTYLSENKDSKLFSKVTDKVIKINDKGKYSGFVLNQGPQLNTAEALPDRELRIGISDKVGMNINQGTDILENLINRNFLSKFKIHTAFIFVPLGKKNGKIQYHAAPLLQNKVTPSQAKMLRQAIEIFVTQDKTLYPELQAAWKGKLDFTNKKDLTKLLEKVLYLYNSKSNKKTIEQQVTTRTIDGNPVPMIEFTGNTIKIGKTAITNDKPVYNSIEDKSLFLKSLDIIEKSILGNMYVNINKAELNSSKDFEFVEIDESGTYVPFKGTYNDFVKKNTSTYQKSTLLDDSTPDKQNYAYTIQNIVRFGMDNVVPKVEKKQEVQKEPVVQNTQQPETVTNTTEEYLNSLSKELKDRVIEYSQILYKDLTRDEALSKFLAKVVTREITLEQRFKFAEKTIEAINRKDDTANNKPICKQ